MAILNEVELVERVRGLRAPQRLMYALGVALGFTALLVGSLVAAVLAGLLFIALTTGGVLTLPDDAINVGLPVSILYLLAIGFSGLGGEHPSGYALSKAMRHGLRRGFLVGVVVGLIGGFLLSFIFSGSPASYAALMACALAVGVALFKGGAPLIEPFSLRLVGGG